MDPLILIRPVIPSMDPLLSFPPLIRSIPFPHMIRPFPFPSLDPSPDTSIDLIGCCGYDYVLRSAMECSGSFSPFTLDPVVEDKSQLRDQLPVSPVTPS